MSDASELLRRHATALREAFLRRHAPITYDEYYRRDANGDAMYNVVRKGISLAGWFGRGATVRQRLRQERKRELAVAVTAAAEELRTAREAVQGALAGLKPAYADGKFLGRLEEQPRRRDMSDFEQRAAKFLRQHGGDCTEPMRARMRREILAAQVLRWAVLAPEAPQYGGWLPGGSFDPAAEVGLVQLFLRGMRHRHGFAEHEHWFEAFEDRLVQPARHDFAAV